MSKYTESDIQKRCVLVALMSGKQKNSDHDLDELQALAESAGLVPVARYVYRRSREHAAFFIGAGQADEIARAADEAEAGLIVFDNELGPVQQRNLNGRWELPVLDRTELILEIFSARAQSREGKLQVELAQLEHLSARLVRGWTHLERQRGGIGGRGGPGEKQVELDRRMLATRVKRLRRDLEQLRGQRANRRRARHRNRAIRISLVGYTNAGKSTLFNRLTGAKAHAADQLFATLDTLTRRMYLPEYGEVMLSDTVGFVRDLPHSLVEAFKATLEETADADLLLHVIDGSSPQRREQIEQVERVLKEIGAQHVPIIEVFNKADQIPAAGQVLPQTGNSSPEAANGQAPSSFEQGACDSIGRVAVSAQTGQGIEQLLALVTHSVQSFESANSTESLATDTGDGVNMPHTDARSS